jgi:hypothetical protein
LRGIDTATDLAEIPLEIEALPGAVAKDSSRLAYEREPGASGIPRSGKTLSLGRAGMDVLGRIKAEACRHHSLPLRKRR